MSLAPSIKTPQVRASIVFGSAGSAPSNAREKVLLIGSKITTDISAVIHTGSSTTVTVATTAGTAPLDRVTRVTSPDDAAVKVGHGSELHLAAIDAYAQSREVDLYLAPLTPGDTPVAASVTITPTLSSLAAGTLRITVCGRSVDIGISAADTVSTIGRKMATAINAQVDWPCTAANTWSTGATVLTAKFVGPRGNALTVRCALLTSTDTIEVVDGTGTTAFGLTITMSGGAADGGVYRFSAGAVDDSVAALLTQILPTKFDRVCFAGYRVSGSASANLALISAQLVTQSDAQFDQQAVFGAVESPANTITLSQGINAERCAFAESPGSDDLPLSIAAQVAVGRLYGDDIVGGSIDGESVAPACNLNGLELATLRAPRDPGDLMDATEVENALNAGVSPLGQSPSRPGRMVLLASVTSRSLSGGQPFFATYKTKDVTVADYARAYVTNDLRTTYRGFNLVANPASGAPSLAPKTVAPRSVAARIYGLLKELEKRGILTDVDARRDQITAQINGTNPRRLDYAFPTVAPRDFDIADGTLYQL